MKTLRVFLDANVLFAACNDGSATQRVVHLLLKRAEVLTCDYAVMEARRNLELKWPTKAANLKPLVGSIGIVRATTFPLSVRLADKDAPILCAAILSKSTHLATGDKRDFGHLYDKSVQGVTVVSMLRLTEMLL